MPLSSQPKQSVTTGRLFKQKQTIVSFRRICERPPPLGRLDLFMRADCTATIKAAEAPEYQ